MLPRIGTFLILVGCALLILFFTSIYAGDTQGRYLLFAVVAILIGILFRSKVPHAESTRFSSLRQARQRTRQRREEKQANKTEKK